MNKEFLEKRLEELKKQFDQVNLVLSKSEANLHAINGAINECHFHLNELDKSTNTEKKD